MRRSFLYALPLALSLVGFVLVGCQGGGDSPTAAADSTASGEKGQVQQASVESGPAVEAGTYKLDGAHSKLGFRVRHMGISSVEGSFDEADATITFPSENLADMQAEATMQTASVNTGNDKRDGHLRSGDFFNAEQYPTITFETNSVTPTGDGQFEMTGDLTIKDTTKTVTLQGEYLGAVEGPQGKTHAGFEASGEINRQDFGLTWSKTTPGGELVVGDQVELVLDVEAIRQQESGQGEQQPASE